MSDEKLADQIEKKVEDLKDLSWRFLNTFGHLVTRRRQLIEHLEEPRPENSFLGPNTFLLIAAILIGFFGSILMGGLNNVGIETIFSLRNLSPTSFFNLSLPLFGVAIIGRVMVSALWWKASSRQRQAITYIHYYVIGYFSIGALILLLALSPLLTLTDVHSQHEIGIFKVVSYALIAVYLFHTAWIMVSSSHALVSGKGSGSSVAAVLKSGFLSITILALSSANFFFNIQQQPLVGTLMDIEQRHGSVIKLTYVALNTTEKALAISLAETPRLTTKSDGGELIKNQAFWSETDQEASDLPGFRFIEPGKSVILSSFVRGPAFARFLKENGYAEIGRDADRKRLYSVAGSALTFELKVRVFDGDHTSPYLLSLQGNI